MEQSNEQHKTPWAILCPSDGKVYLTKAQYHKQMMSPNKKWDCPECGMTSEWDDDNFESYHESEEGSTI